MVARIGGFRRNRLLFRVLQVAALVSILLLVLLSSGLFDVIKAHLSNTLRYRWDFSAEFAARKVDSATGTVSAIDPTCNSRHVENRAFTECNQAFLRATVASPHLTQWGSTSSARRFVDQAAESTASRPHGTAPGSTWPQHMDIRADTSYNDACRARNASCPLLWVAFATMCRVGTNRLASSLEQLGIPLAVLGMGTLWKNRWGYRMRALHDLLLHEPDERLVVWSDAEDVIPTPDATPDRILKQYRSLVDMYQGPRIFFPAETACYPDGSLWSNYTDPNTLSFAPGQTPFRYLNAGLMIGPAGLIRRMIEVVYQDDCFDDQLAYTLAFLDPLKWWMSQSRVVQVGSSTKQVVPTDAKPLIGLDYWNGLLMAMYGVSNKDYVVDAASKKLTIKATGGSPLIMHQNGEKKDNAILEILAKELGYDYEADKLDKFRKIGWTYQLLSQRQ
ncbi:hypothetical protein HK105_207987 [Polyrhizophydium stewartii]|uniref:PLOD1-3-like GT domain-containing protein n=1 Tax=Polyrhizophydium stewartii TaxID=2732419 RepID=A0ABR4MZ44_9FUNG|nr:hypothetical protein HK105_008000 [Polyrhizophydium stewartii]